MTNDEMASVEMRKWKEEEERRHIEENVMLTEASEKRISTLNVFQDENPKPREEAEPPKEEAKPVVTETVSKTIEMSSEAAKERERQIAALLKAIPTAISTPKKEESEKFLSRI